MLVAILEPLLLNRPMVLADIEDMREGSGRSVANEKKISYICRS